MVVPRVPQPLPPKRNDSARGLRKLAGRRPIKGFKCVPNRKLYRPVLRHLGYALSEQSRQSNDGAKPQPGRSQPSFGSGTASPASTGAPKFLASISCDAEEIPEEVLAGCQCRVLLRREV
jgi:hypothetical protein